MNNRIALLMKEEGLTSSRLAEILEVQASSISHILSGRNKPSFDFIEKMLLRFPSINPDWLITGIGEIYRSNYPLQSVTGKFQYTDKQHSPDTYAHQEELSFENVRDIQASPIQASKVIDSDKNVSNQPCFGDMFDSEDIERIIIFYKNKKFVSYKP